MAIEHPATTADGEVDTCSDVTVVLRFHRHLTHPPERVWAALTEPEQIAAWWG
jgi:uncharacterized protein YndB with AHSA1/START domain